MFSFRIVLRFFTGTTDFINVDVPNLELALENWSKFPWKLVMWG